MNNEIIRTLDEAIKLELNISDLYQIFHEKIKEDSKFWWQLLLEEKNHAALLKTGKDIYLKKNDIPLKIFKATLKSLIESNKIISEYIKKFNNITAISRVEALQIAHDLEKSAGELHYQQSMEKEADSTLLKIFQDLNSEDKNHAARIKKYVENNNLKI